MMIRSFRGKLASAVFRGERPARVSTTLAVAARRKLELIEAAATLNDLRSPPGNRLEALSGARLGQHSIRINGQFRVCFVWRDGAADDVEIVDYH